MRIAGTFYRLIAWLRAPVPSSSSANAVHRRPCVSLGGGRLLDLRPTISVQGAKVLCRASEGIQDDASREGESGLRVGVHYHNEHW